MNNFYSSAPSTDANILALVDGLLRHGLRPSQVSASTATPLEPTDSELSQYDKLREQFELQQATSRSPWVNLG